MIKNKKLLFLSAVISVAPIMIVASCSNNTPTENPKDPIDPVEPPFQPVEPPRPPFNPPTPKPIDPSKIDDSIKAMANVKLLLAQETYSRVKSLSPDENILSSLPRLEPKKNFNFETNYKFIEKDMDKGEMKIEIILKRGKQEVKEIITIDGFLTPEVINNENNDNFINPAKVLDLSLRDENGIFKLQEQGGWEPGPGEPGGPGGHFPFPFPQIPQNSNTFRILQRSKGSLLKNPNDASAELFWLIPEKGYEENPIRWKNNFGLGTNVGRINFRLVKKENPKIRSRILIGQVGLEYENDKENEKNAAWYTFNTIYTPINDKASNFKASEINSQEKLLNVLDLKGDNKDIPGIVNKFFYSKIDLGGFFYKPELANDQEGSLIVPLKEGLNGMRFIKLYGFKIDPDA